MFSATKSAELKLLNIAIRVSQWYGCPKTKTRQKESVLDPRQDKSALFVVNGSASWVRGDSGFRRLVCHSVHKKCKIMPLSAIIVINYFKSQIQIDM